MRRYNTYIRVAALLLGGVASCADDQAPTAELIEAQAPTDEAAEASPPEPDHDLDDEDHPPVFGGLEEVELVGLQTFRLRWSAAEDDFTPPDQLRYRVYHVVEPFAELTADATPIYTSAPGVTEARIANDAPAGRFYVRAVDAAGNVSALAQGILQRPSRPLLRVSATGLSAPLTACARHRDGALCVGTNGAVARWDGHDWTQHDVGVSEDLRIADTPSGLFVYSSVGHLFSVGDDGAPALVELRFASGAPELPFRQFTADPTGLRYWIDTAGRVFISADRDFVPMSRPLALPGDTCRRLRGLSFGDVAAFALCEGGAAFSMSTTGQRQTWLSLTPNADFVTTHGIESLVSDVETEAIFVDSSGARIVGVTGWRPLLLVDWNQPGIHPMDVPENPPEISRVIGVYEAGDALFAATDSGLFEYRGLEWYVVNGLDRPLAGVLAPPRDGGRQPWTFIFTDGSVAAGTPGSTRWRLAPETVGFDRVLLGTDGSVLGAATSGGNRGLYRWDGEDWTRSYPIPDLLESTAGFAQLPGAALLVFGSDGQRGMIQRYDGRAWSQVRWLYPPPPPPAAAPAAPVAPELVFEPPPPIRGVESTALPAPPPQPEPITYVDVARDGRAVAIGSHQVWWRTPSGWLLLTTRTSTLEAVWLDAGETYVLLEQGTLVRCWRNTCGDPVQPAAGAPTTSVRAFYGRGGLEVTDRNGDAWAFAPAQDDTYGLLVDPAAETEPGAWQPSVSVAPYSASVQQRLATAGVMLTSDGEILERDGDEWILQEEATSATALLESGPSWVMVTPEGLFRLGEVRPALSKTEDP